MSNFAFRPGSLVSEKGGYKHFEGRDMPDVTRGGRKVVRKEGHVVVNPEGHETYFGKGDKAKGEAQHWQDTWSRKAQPGDK